MINNAFMQLPTDVREAISTQAGVVLSQFDPTQSTFSVSDIKPYILMATTGGVTVSCTQTVNDWAEDVDNAPAGAKELQEGGAWDCKMSGTAITIDADLLALCLGAATKTTVTTGYTIIQPRMNIEVTDFNKIWYVVPYGVDGGFVAVELSNAFSSGGFSFKSEKDNKGQTSFEFKGYGTVADTTFVPMKFHIKESTTQAVEESTNNNSGSNNSGSNNSGSDNSGSDNNGSGN